MATHDEQRTALATFLDVEVHDVESYLVKVHEDGSTIVVNYVEVTDPTDPSEHLTVPIIVLPLFKDQHEAATAVRILLEAGVHTLMSQIIATPPPTKQ